MGETALELNDLDLLVEHQANFAMIPMTLERLMNNGGNPGRSRKPSWTISRTGW